MESECSTRRTKDRRTTYTGPSSWRLTAMSVTLMLLWCCSLVHSQAVEAYFNGTSWLTLNSSSASQTTNLYQIGLSFRTCGPRGFGVLFSQVSSSETNKQLPFISIWPLGRR
jgi:hypothetical protein